MKSKSTDRITTGNVFEKWGRNYPAVTRWLGKLQSKDRSCFNLYRFCQLCGLEPDNLLSLKTDTNSTKAEELLDSFVASEETGFTHTVKVNMTIAVKSFFKHNYKDN